MMQWPVIGIIYPSLSPETGWAGGIGLQGCWNMPGEENLPSTIRFMGSYTQYKQWKVQTQGSFYMGGEIPWVLHFNVQYRDWPDQYFGIGNTMQQAKDYASKRASFTLEPLIRLPRHWNVGPMADFLWEKNNLPNVDTTYHGSNNTLMWGIGISSQYDTRDVINYPTRGMLFNFKGFYCEPALGSSCRLWKLDADFRHHVTLWQPKEFESDFERVNKALVFSYQIRMQAAFSTSPTEEIPFQMLPTLGGDEILRGIRANTFRDNLLWAVQSELRFPIYSILRGTVFASVGDVYNTDHWHWATPKVGYGLGLRLAINKAHVNVRFDIARNNIDKSWGDWDSYSFYITASEAF